MEKQTVGTIASVKTLWWIKVNTKPVRKHALDGAVFPHILQVRYSVDGREYTRRKYVGAAEQCPREGDKVSVTYRDDKPAKGRIAL